MRYRACLLALAWGCAAPPARLPQDAPLVRTVDLDLGEAAEVVLWDGARAKVRLLTLDETRDDLCFAVRRACVKVDVNGEMVTLRSGNYELPVTAARVQIDCPVTRGYQENSNTQPWGLLKAARLRLWPAGSPWAAPGTFVYPARQRWFATHTQMANEPVFVDGGDVPGKRKVYYHYGLDIGGSEGDVEVVAATSGRVVSCGKETLPGHEGTPVAPRYDVVYLQDPQGWYYRYSHLKTIDLKLGQEVRPGDRVGLLGKEGGSGGWSHLHFDINARQPSGKWGIQEGYAFLWEAYRREHAPPVIAVARPHHFIRARDKVVLEGTRSWAAAGIARADWTFGDGTTATGLEVERAYDRPGMHSETLKVTDRKGNVAYDFAVVQVVDGERLNALPPSIQAVYSPTFGIRAGRPVTFKVRTFRTRDGEETWDFGDGTPPVKVKSDGNVKPLAPDGFAETTHAFARPGNYIVSVERANAEGMNAVTRLWVTVE